ncbi:MAG: RluA family pseudouridine synthase [Acidobacteria bacterium]|nr:RluA family pseudouridine synthase [Acidobacteriota bacterium]
MLSILYQDSDVLAVDKPPGRVVIPDRARAGKSLREIVDDYLTAFGERGYVVHRLDRGTSGVVLFARSAAAHRALNLSFDRGEAEKGYLALVEGDMSGEGTVDTALYPARRGRMRPAKKDERGQPSLTRWKVLERFERLTWVELRPATGRSHQLRVHLKYIGHPLAFDPTYGRKTPLTACDLVPAVSSAGRRIVLQRTPLHACWIRIPHPSGTGMLFVESPLPDDLKEALRLLRAAAPETEG